ncbi:conserved hypothetical protein [Clostridium carboxidivorans P7]|uniref:DUF2812 domain-containing protein n=1 Tax=Clostridium carboxidivorans P7 TaxID=536227 RepID=C6PVU7_9CLOT|nr:DUF2812 domain-containing protein [Clostridium carboxidivorans]EET86644.1 conserved hypothetical protein [Clostridium carboxidivorans P7]
MEENKKYVRKSFLVHQYEKEEEFLSNMAKEGWHFVKLHKGIPTKYEFVKGEKVDYIYQLDFVAAKEDAEDYHQLFEDAGWNEIYSWTGIGGKWYYFRKVHSEGQVERIFTDSESKYDMYNKLWKKFGLYLMFSIIIELNAILICADRLKQVGLVSAEGAILTVMCCLLIFFIILFGSVIMGIISEKNKIKRRLGGML